MSSSQTGFLKTLRILRTWDSRDQSGVGAVDLQKKNHGKQVVNGDLGTLKDFVVMELWNILDFSKCDMGSKRKWRI